MATITDIKTVQRVFCTGDPTTANALGCDLNPGDLVVRTDGGTHYVMTAAGLVLESSMDQSPSFTTVAVTTSATVTSASAVALAVGLAGATNPAFVVDSSTGSQAAGLKITGATAAGNVAAAVISSGAAANLTIDAKGTGTVTIGATSTGNVILGDAFTCTSAGAVSGVTTLAIGGALSGVTTLAASSSILSSGAAGGIGYTTGAGGAQTQLTDKSTGVASNTITTAITMNAASLAAATVVSFTFTNTSIAATDTVLCTHESAGTSAAYTVNAFPAAGSAVISVRNNTAGALAEAIVLRVTVIKSVSA